MLLETILVLCLVLCLELSFFHTEMDVGNKYHIQPVRGSLTLESFTSWRSGGALMLRRWTCPIHGDLFPCLPSYLTLLEILKSFIPSLKRPFSDYTILHNQVIILVFYYLLLN